MNLTMLPLTWRHVGYNSIFVLFTHILVSEGWGLLMVLINIGVMLMMILRLKLISNMIVMNTLLIRVQSLNNRPFWPFWWCLIDIMYRFICKLGPNDLANVKIQLDPFNFPDLLSLLILNFLFWLRYSRYSLFYGFFMSSFTFWSWSL